MFSRVVHPLLLPFYEEAALDNGRRAAVISNHALVWDERIESPRARVPRPCGLRGAVAAVARAPTFSR